MDRSKFELETEKELARGLELVNRLLVVSKDEAKKVSVLNHGKTY